jgi:pimeloyl-ACP methyl ester carboxylesterase
LAASLLFAGAVAGLAALTPLLAARRERTIEAQFPPLGQRVGVVGRRVHVLQRGAGPDVLILHGASGNLRDLLPLIDALAPQFRVTAFDRPGLGWSDPIPDGQSLAAQARHLSLAARSLGIDRPLLIGQSFGGSVALSWALEGLLSPRALVLVSAPSLPWPGPLDPWYRLTALPLGRALAIPLAAAFVPATYIAATTRAIFAPDPVPPGYAGTIGAMLALRRSALYANTAQVNALRAQLVDQSTRYPMLSLPVELIHGDADAVVPFDVHSGPLSAILPAARLTVLPGGGHMPHHSALDAVLATVHRAHARSGSH